MSSMNKDLYNRLGVPVATLPNQTVSAEVADTAPADLAGFESALILITAGAITGTHSSTLVIQDSDIGGTLAASYGTVAATDLIGGGTLTAFGTANANTVIRRGYIGDKRYVRVAASTGAGSGVQVSAVVVPGDPRHLPDS